MDFYQNIHGNSGVKAYSILPEGISVQFINNASYLYTYKSAGKKAVEQMKHLAKRGKGLSTFISRYVKDKFEKKL